LKKKSEKSPTYDEDIQLQRTSDSTLLWERELSKLKFKNLKT